MTVSKGYVSCVGPVSHDKQEDKAAEERMSLVEDSLPAISKDLKGTIRNMNTHLNKVDDLEYRLRKNNICLVGILERDEDCNPVVYIKLWLVKTFF